MEARVRVRERRVFGGVEFGRVRGDGSHNTLVELVNVARGNDAGRSVRSFIPGYGIDGHCTGAGYVRNRRKSVVVPASSATVCSQVWMT